MTTLTEFLTARIQEDRDRFALPDFAPDLREDGWGSRGDCPVCDAHQWSGTEEVTEEAWWAHVETEHAREVGEWYAFRRILELHAPVSMIGDAYCSTCGDVPQVDYPCETLRALAAVYADHPDYQETWRP